MRPLSEATARITGENFKRKYVALGRIVKHWPEIVGEKLSTKAQPVKINYRKHRQSKQPIATLDIAVSAAEATTLHYQKDLILERINQIFGERWISAIRFVQTPVNQSQNSFGLLRKKRAISLNADEEKTLSHMLDVIDDEEIKARLMRLGEGVLKDEKIKGETR